MLLNFLFPRLMPGGPISYIDSGHNKSFEMTEEQKQAVESYYGLDESIFVQLTSYVKGVITADFGNSISYQTSVIDLIMVHAKWTILLVSVSTIFMFIIGIGLGLISGWLQHKKSDGPLFTSMISIGAVPGFVLGMLSLLFFSTELGLFPFGGSATQFLSVEEGLAGYFSIITDVLYHAALPISVLTIAGVTSIYLLIRNSTVEILNEPYMYAAEAKGLKRRKILVLHALKNAILPIFTLLTLKVGLLITGAILVETVFSYPGIGKLLQEAILQRDYPLMHGLFFVFTITILCTNFIADFIYPKLDPRMRNRGGIG